MTIPSYRGILWQYRTVLIFLISPNTTNCHNLVTTLSQPYKIAARLLQPSYFRMGYTWYNYSYAPYNQDKW